MMSAFAAGGTGGADRWPGAGDRLLAELDQPGRLALVVGPRDAGLDVIGQLCGLGGGDIVSVTEAILGDDPARREQDLLDRIGDAGFLVDLECLCWQPFLPLDPLKLCRRVARSRGVVALWPGEVTNRTATFSTPGRRDAVSVSAADTLVLRPKTTGFPDETPFTIERIAA